MKTHGAAEKATAKEPDQVVRSLGHGAMWSGVNSVVTKLAGIAITAVVVRMVTPYDFGIFAVALVIYAVVSSFGELGLSACIARRDMDPDSAAPVVATLALISCLFLAVGMYTLAPQLGRLLGAEEAADAIRVLSICVFLTGFTTVPSAMLLRDFRQGRLFAATLISFIPSNAVLVILAIHGDGAMAFAWSRVVGQVIAGVVVITAVRPFYWPRWNSKVARQVLLFGLPLAGANLLNYLLLNADYAFIGRLLGTAMLGTYTLAFNVASWSTSVLGATINGVAMPAFSERRANLELLLGALDRWSRLASLIAFPIAAATIAFAPEVIFALYGPTWSKAAPILAILAFYGGIFVVSLLLSNFLVGTGRTGWVFLIQLVWLSTLIPSVALGIQFLGLEGAAYAHVFVIVVVIIPMYLIAMRKVSAGIPRLLCRAIVWPLFASIAAAVAAWYSVFLLEGPVIRLLAGGTLGGVFYLVLAWPRLRDHLPERILGRISGVDRLYARFGQGIHRKEKA